MKIQLPHTYADIISLENLLAAWQEFVRGKRKKRDVQEFSLNLMDNIVSLHEDLQNRAYQHGTYQSFYINDPKRRHIHKASVRDRLVHHAVYRILYPFFDRTFIPDSYSCRKRKGTHKAINRFRNFAYQASRNHTRTCWVLKCDIRKFFASIDHAALSQILLEYIPDQDIMRLLRNIIESFQTGRQPDTGLPLGNLTSQLFVNIYMNVFDQWVKHELKARQYLRYADDFALLSHDRNQLERTLPQTGRFLTQKLSLTLHPEKMCIKTLASGVDYLGWVQFSDHRVLRRATKCRMFARLRECTTDETVKSYVGLLRQGNAVTLQKRILSLRDPE